VSSTSNSSAARSRAAYEALAAYDGDLQALR
jgi:hypothetical protein